jgi:hypothetical protein
MDARRRRLQIGSSASRSDRAHQLVDSDMVLLAIMRKTVEREKFIVNDAGKKVSVVMSYRKYRRLMEDLHDLTVLAERRHEKAIPFEEFEEQLKKDGLL